MINPSDFKELVKSDKFERDQDVVHNAIFNSLNSIESPKGIDRESYLETIMYVVASTCMGATLAAVREDYGTEVFEMFKKAFEDRVDSFSEERARRKVVN